MHNGGILAGGTGNTFGGTSANRYVYFYFDPDGKYSGNTTGPGKSVVIDVYFNGRISIGGRTGSSATNSYGTDFNWPDDPYPDWFSWN